MRDSLLYFSTAACWLALAALAWRAARSPAPAAAGGNAPAGSFRIEGVLLPVALVLHGMLVYTGVLADEGLNLGVSNSISLIVWLTVAFYWLASLAVPGLASIQGLWAPVALAAVILQAALPSHYLVHYGGDPLFTLQIAGRAVSLGLAARRLRTPPIQRVSRDRQLPHSFAQERLWYLDQLEPGNPAYNCPAAIRLTGPLNVAVLEKSFEQVLQRHEILRTTIATVDGIPTQIISPLKPFTLPTEDLRHLPKQQQEAAVQRLITEEAERPFNLATGPLLRASVLRVDGAVHVLLVTVHHIVCDEWTAEGESQRIAQQLKEVEVQRQTLALETANLAKLTEQLAAEKSAMAAERDAIKADRDRAAAEAEAIRKERDELAGMLKRALSSVAETTETARGVIVSLSGILFDVNRATLKPASQLTVAKLAGILMVFSNMNLSIDGYTDSTGSADLNMKLSLDRARAVYEFLLLQGIGGDRMKFQGLGPENPVAPNDTEANRAKNRRVEVVLTQAVKAP